mmetsp:Transcript_48156/g.112623  ORF Transcript_48156/g.112623 Transcript_48156/m.112623 type:complete len:206 (-) Transcript_48156:959-1576(-)
MVDGKPATLTCMMELPRNIAANGDNAEDHVAEKSIVCLLPAWHLLAKAVTSSQKPSSKSLSPSSITSRCTSASATDLCARAPTASAPLDAERLELGVCPQRAHNRPGVATNSDGASFNNDSRCRSGSTPPTTAAANPSSAAATLNTWNASSRVGTITNTRGRKTSSRAQSPSNSDHSSNKASFFPDIARALWAICDMNPMSWASS